MTASVVGATTQGAHAVTTCIEGPTCPSLVDDAYTTAFGKKLTVTAALGVLANDSLPAGWSVDVVDSDSSSWNDGPVTLHPDGSFTYTPPADFSGIDSFDYYIQDDQGNFIDLASAYITIPGVAKADTYGARVGQALIVDAAHGILANDLYVDGPSYGITTHTETLLGDVSVDDDGSFEYTPPSPTFTGPDSFSYEVSDIDDDLTYTATVTIYVDSTAPKVTVSAPAAVTLSTSIPVKWAGSDASGIQSYTVQQRSAAWNANFGAYSALIKSTSSVSSLATASYGRTYCYVVNATDKAGNTSSGVTKCTAVPMRANVSGFSQGWTTASSSRFFSGIVRRSAVKGSKFTKAGVQAKHLYIVATKCSTCGSVQVRWNNVVTANISLARSTTLYKQVIPVGTFTSARVGTLSISVTSANGKVVYIEGIAASRT